MSISVTELKLNLEKYLMLSEIENPPLLFVTF